MVPELTQHSRVNVTTIGILSLMTIGVLSLTVMADLAGTGPLALGFAAGGGVLYFVSGLWWLQLLDDRDRSDERFLQIGFRASTLSFWALFAGLLTFASIEGAYDVTYPVVSNYSWLLLLGLTVFLSSWAWYERRM